MADLIDRDKLLSAYDAAHKGQPGGARKLIAEAPAVDAVEVVRCKDCRHWQEIANGEIHYGHCDMADDSQVCPWNFYCGGAIKKRRLRRMAEYHVSTSDISGAIYAGEGVKFDNGIMWDNKSEVTSEAINAVMAHMLYRIKNAKMDNTYDECIFAYANKTRDGRYLRLKLEVSDTKPSWLDDRCEKND